MKDRKVLDTLMVTKEQIKTLSPSAKKHIRGEKARIRREFLDAEEQQKHILKVYHKFIREVAPENKEEKSEKAMKSVKKTGEKKKAKPTKQKTKSSESKKAVRASKTKEKTAQ